MTPAERARQIDREEFAAECAAIRQRAYAMLGMPLQRTTQVEQWIKRKERKGSIKPTGMQTQAVAKAKRTHAANAKLYTAFGSTRTLPEWAAETGLSRHTIRNRLNLGWTIEQALTLVPQRGVKPGVVSNLPPLKGTGAGSTAQETSNISFSESNACPQ